MSYQFSTTTSLSDETYLESFVESISASLPNELRRNLEHLRDLDNVSSALIEDWRERQDVCLKGVEETLLKVIRVEASEAAAAAAVAASMSPARGTKRKQPEEESPEKACYKCRAKKVRCDGKQQDCLFYDSDSSDDDESVGEQKHTREQGDSKEGKQGETPNNNDQEGSTLSLSESQISEFLQKRGPPTNEEIRTALHIHNPQYISQRDEITNIYHELQQFSSEKIDTANQLKSLVDMALGRLDRDIAKFEKELGIDRTSSNTAGPNNTGGGGSIAGGGLGMIGHHSHRTSGGVVVGAGTHAVGNNSSTAPIASSAASAPTAVTTNNPSRFRRSSSATSPVPPPPSNPAMQQPYPTTRGIVPPSPKFVQTSNLAAIQVTPNSPDWILAKILSHDKSAKMYTLSDEDVQSNQIYKIPEKQVVVLKGTERNKWNRGDVVYAVYPDTTSFYHATVSTPPLKGFVMVQFKDDWDANGVTHEKAVLMAHVMKVPPVRK